MKRDSREKILESAILTMSRAPQSSMEALASKIGVSRTTLYRHFNTREQMLKEMIFESGRIFDAIITPILAENIAAKEKLERFITAFVPSGARFHFLLYNDLFFHDPLIDGVYQNQNKTFKKLAEEMKAEGSMDVLIPEEWFATTIEYMIYAAWERIYRGDVALNKAAGLIIGMIFKGIQKKINLENKGLENAPE